jgi:acylphosphatase
MAFRKRKPESSARRGTVTGRVQSVAFRFYARQEAVQLGLAGWVRNLPDGSVEYHVQGPPAELEEFLAWLRLGPPHARVSEVTARECEHEAHDTFEIR